MPSWRHAAGIAAGHPATARAGLEVLAEGGTAADVAVAAAMASCVAETVMTGIAGGGHAIWWDAARARAELLDCFVAVPGLGTRREPARLVDLEIPFGEQPVRYAVGIATCAVPGLPAGLDELWRRHGRLPWRRLCEPAVALARSGVELPPAHAACLAMLEPVMTMREGGAIYAPDGQLLAAGGRLRQPGLARTFELVAEEGASSFYRGTLASELLDLMDERGGVVTAEDLDAYEARWLAPAGCRYAGADIHTRAGLAGLVETLSRLPELGSSSPGDRALALVRALDGGDRSGHTTNLAVVDPAGNACVLTTSLGLGSGDFLPGLDVHLNSMLGESELLVGTLEAGERMQSMMAPTFAVDDDGLVLAAGSAGGSRLRSALVQVLAAILDEGLDPVGAVERPRLHPADGVVHAEPGFPEAVYGALETDGYSVRRWPAKHHYFGGTSVVARTGAAGDPRRSGLALNLGTQHGVS
jgi:gamma-glutamyltranspeptidase/glutathione hydrolase